MCREIMRHKFIDRDERTDVIALHSSEWLFRMLDVAVEESRTIAGATMYAAWLHGCVKIDKGGVQWHYLHKSAKYANSLQLTTWDERGPVSDMRVRTADDFSYLMNGELSVLSPGDDY